ncbi:hypothetical protein B0A55_08213 [Friedmanniomyces simplex]|uniref:GST N-terminal domain-containing protein n=1 Tax=Friedmanniomyces simplex TaxID=329884 RepID=A0A4U0X7Q9_9PEZI|nr:hypothetical protein B0A55_08213 [Friedmanniomyces simplex]
MSSEAKLLLWDHSTSSYAQKIRIALREKSIPFTSKRPEGLGSGGPVPDLEDANPRLEVPALEDGDFKIFDSTVILAYLEEKYPDTPPLLPKDPRERATARMIEEICDTVYEATNWGYSEIVWSQRATGELAEKLTAQVKYQTGVIQTWLADKLGEKEYFNGSTFGYADLCVAPILNRSVFYGFGPAEGTPLQRWHARIKDRPSVKPTFAEMEEGAKMMATTMKKAFTEGPNKRQYRDHRLEWMVKSGGIDVVLEGLKRENIRFGWPPAAQ